MQKIASLLTFTLALSALSSSFAAAVPHDCTAAGRYITVANKPTAGQVNLLTQTIQVRFPQKVQTIGGAMDYLLRFSGYRLITPVQRSPALNLLLSKPLPAVDRDFGPLSLQEGLITLAGPAFYLVHDPLNRTVDFRIKPAVARLHKNLTPKKPMK